MKNYFKVLLQGCLKVEKGDTLFISMSYKDKGIIELLAEVIYELGVADFNISYYEFNDNKLWSNYISKGSKFLFLVNENWAGTLSSKIATGFRNDEIGIDYTIAPTLEMLFKYDKTVDYIKDANPLIGFNKFNSQYNRAITTFKNYKFNQIALKTLTGTSLSFQFCNDFKYRRNGVINMFPLYGVEMLPHTNSTQGFIDASKATFIEGYEVEGLRLCIEDGMIMDFDSENYCELVCKSFKKPNAWVVESLCLIDSSMPLYNYLGQYNNEVLDASANSYVTLVSKESDKIYVPIQSKTLSVIGETYKGKVKIYEKEKIAIF